MPEVPPPTFHAPSVVGFVVVTALLGTGLGGAFGFVAGWVGPDLFRYLVPWEKFEPVGVATVIGAFGGTMCGGGLGVFAVAVQLAARWIERRGRGREG